MDKLGYLRTGAAVPVVKLADPAENTGRICKLLDEAVEKQVAFVVFPELCITGYTCGDLFFQQELLNEAEKAVADIVSYTSGKSVTAAIGAPVRHNGHIYNCAIVINDGHILGLVPKTYLPNYNEFSECRWFSSGTDFISKYANDEAISDIEYAGQKTHITPNQLFDVDGACIGIEICEDVWVPIPRSSYLAIEGAQVIANLSASNEVVNKTEYRKQLVRSQTGQRILGYIYCSAGFGESTANCVFAGSSMIYENGLILAEGKPFCTEAQLVIADIDIEKLDHRRNTVNTFYGVTPDGTDVRGFRRFFIQKKSTLFPRPDFAGHLYRPTFPHPFVPAAQEMDGKCGTAFEIQATGLISRMLAIGCRKVVLGVSGGLDSTLALLCAVKAFDKMGWSRDGIIGITMPGFGTSSRTHGNATSLMKNLGINHREISIANACIGHLADIGHDGCTQDVTYENAQARERTQILMDVANMENAIVIGTGDLSELALGWCTYNGDHMSNYSVNATIPKTLIRALVTWAAQNDIFGNEHVSGILLDIVDTPISPELKGSGKAIEQKTEDNIGPYELHDFFLYYMIQHGFGPEKIVFLACKAFDGKYDADEIRKWFKVFIKRFFASGFKRSCAPDGPKVGPVSLSGQGDWKMPSDIDGTAWKNL